ncbi:hypothetical protein FNJ84_01145 [Paracoccus sp. M683]|uniref:hypothetical protein n=1 Tax=Paracoccus sp. M683 TaxID=2594268 RepID=UPI001180B1CF|nr:hypothetical protein [Paracoccus sp. M683]TRW99311.1 hypothetical protein FNJ84_01145 [Paracoccus sp. M683]
MSLRKRIGAALGSDEAVTIGIVLTALWLLMAGLFWLFGPDADAPVSGLLRLASALAVLLPVVLIWMAVGLAGALATLRAEAAELRLRLGQMRDAAGRVTAGAMATDPAPAPAAQTAAAQAAPRRAHAPAAAPQPAAPRPVAGGDGRQTAMRFDAPVSVAVHPDDLIRALNFPEGPDDVETITALRAALRDHDSSRVIRSAQDVVALLAENGLYMEHLVPDAPRPALWRRFAEGMRGDTVQAMGAVHDAAALDLVQAMLKSDEIFRDSAHHFLRHFDLMLTRIGGGLDDAQLARLADTRSARAFMLLGRAANVFG